MLVRLLVQPIGLILIVILTFSANQTVYALQPGSDSNSVVCSGTPAEIGSVLAPEVATTEDIQAFHKAVPSLRTELDTLCKQDKNASKLLKSKADKVVFEMSSGAIEPTAYFKDKHLIIEFYGGSLDARQFRQIVKKVLQGKPIPLSD